MDLHSPQDRILLKNCIVVKIKQLHLDMHKPNADFSATKKAIDYYSKLKELLESDNTENLIATLNTSIDSTDYLNFNQYILSTPAKDIANDYLDLTKSLLLENGVYSDENFEKLKNAFLSGNENLNPSEKTKNLDELEEEPEPSTHVTPEMQELLDKFAELFKKSHPQNMSGADFKNFASQLKDLTKKLGISALQPNFDKTNQTIQDMQIFYEKPADSCPVYKVDLTLCDALSHKLSHMALTERANASRLYFDLFSKFMLFSLRSPKIFYQIRRFARF